MATPDDSGDGVAPEGRVSLSRGEGAAPGRLSISRMSMEMGRQFLGRDDGRADEVAPRLSRTSLEMAQQFSERSARVSFAMEHVKKGKESPADLKKEIEMWEHKVGVPELCRKLDTDAERGMTAVAAEKRLALYGPNVLSPPRVTPWYVKLLRQFTNFFALLLIAASVLCFVGYFLDTSNKNNLYLGAVLALVVIGTALFTFFQEHKSDKTMEQFKNFLPPVTLVHRDGKVFEIDASQLVVGDVIDVKLGDKIPADIRIIANQKLKVDNSSLTGESEPQGRTVDVTDNNPLETKNLAFFGTLAIDGTATGVVVNTGDGTVFGRIAGLTAGGEEQPTTLQREIHHFIFFIGALAITVGTGFFIFGLVKKADLVTNCVFAIGMIVANVPEGLLATVTVCLTLTAKRMARKNVLVKKLEAVETLGSTTTICSDKTGTLTQNRMTIVHVVYDQEVRLAPTATQEATFDPENETYKNLFFLAANCAKAKFDDTELAEHPERSIDERKVNGDASEAGILKFAEKQTSIAGVRAANPQVSTIPFNSANKFMVTINEDSQAATGPGTQMRLCMKGAPERVLDRCSQIMVRGVVRPMTDGDREEVNANLAKLMAEGERVLGFGQLALPVDQFPMGFAFDTEHVNFPMEGLVFVGLMALLDPPRESVPGAVQTCLEAGVDVFMVTGDHPATAKSIAKQIGIIRDPTVEDVAAERGVPVSDVDPSLVKAIVVPGSQIQHLTEDEWDRVLGHEQIVFARTSPQQKLLIVENLQRLGKIVAVTGDGVNDSPALKKANIGIAMGISGSDVSKEAADMVLLDDNFSSIVNGIEEGRLIFDNIKKSVAYTISHNIPEIFPFVLFIILGFPAFLTTVLILLIGMSRGRGRRAARRRRLGAAADLFLFPSPPPPKRPRHRHVARHLLCVRDGRVGHHAPQAAPRRRRPPREPAPHLLFVPADWHRRGARRHVCRHGRHERLRVWLQVAAARQRPQQLGLERGQQLAMDVLGPAGRGLAGHVGRLFRQEERQVCALLRGARAPRLQGADRGKVRGREGGQ
jgi:sodium/potassium-transporting ATPase subunit alpha